MERSLRTAVVVGILLVAVVAGAALVQRMTAQPLAAPATATAPPTPTLSPTPGQGTCTPTDQDRYVYQPARLKVLQACLFVTGTVIEVTAEPDGDLHIRLQLDPQYIQYLQAANYRYQAGTIVVEPICVGPGDPICRSDPDPVTVLPVAGEHVWMQGRLVLDMEHEAWSELHPLYAWGHG